MLLLGFPGPSQRNSRDGQGPQYLTNKKNKCSYSLFSFPFSFPSFFSFLFPPFFPFFPFFPSFFLFSFFLFFQGGPRAPLEAPRITGPSKKVRVDTPVSGPVALTLLALALSPSGPRPAGSHPPCSTQNCQNQLN